MRLHQQESHRLEAELLRLVSLLELVLWEKAGPLDEERLVAERVRHLEE